MGLLEGQHWQGLSPRRHGLLVGWGEGKGWKGSGKGVEDPTGGASCWGEGKGWKGSGKGGGGKGGGGKGGSGKFY